MILIAQVLLTFLVVCVIFYVIGGLIARALYKISNVKNGIYLCKDCKRGPSQLFFDRKWWGYEFRCGPCALKNKGPKGFDKQNKRRKQQ